MKMKKKAIMLSSLAIIVLALAVGIGSRYANKSPIADNNNEGAPQQSQEPITVNIDSSEPSLMPEPTTEVIYETEKSIPQEQENVPIPKKPTEKPKPPKATGSYTKPDSHPTYNEQDTVKEPAKETPPPVNESSETANGKIYVEGFGYIEIGGPNQGKIVDSDGDINKQVGSMD